MLEMSDIFIKDNATVYASNCGCNADTAVVIKFSYADVWSSTVVYIDQNQNEQWGKSVFYYNDWLFLGSFIADGAGSVKHVDL